MNQATIGPFENKQEHKKHARESDRQKTDIGPITDYKNQVRQKKIPTYKEKTHTSIAYYANTVKSIKELIVNFSKIND